MSRLYPHGRQGPPPEEMKNFLGGDYVTNREMRRREDAVFLVLEADGPLGLNGIVRALHARKMNDWCPVYEKNPHRRNPGPPFIPETSEMKVGVVIKRLLRFGVVEPIPCRCRGITYNTYGVKPSE